MFFGSERGLFVVIVRQGMKARSQLGANCGSMVRLAKQMRSYHGRVASGLATLICTPGSADGSRAMSEAVAALST